VWVAKSQSRLHQQWWKRMIDARTPIGKTEVVVAEKLDASPFEEPLAALERQLIDEYLRVAGHDPDTLRAQKNDASRKLLAAASVHAAGKLTEVESRAHYMRNLHGEE